MKKKQFNNFNLKFQEDSYTQNYLVKKDNTKEENFVLYRKDSNLNVLLDNKNIEDKKEFYKKILEDENNILDIPKEYKSKPLIRYYHETNNTNNDIRQIFCVKCSSLLHCTEDCPKYVQFCIFCLSNNHKKICQEEKNSCFYCGDQNHQKKNCHYQNLKKCFRCKRVDHKEKKCKYLAETQRHSTINKKSVICLFCSQKGHFNCLQNNMFEDKILQQQQRHDNQQVKSFVRYKNNSRLKQQQCIRLRKIKKIKIKNIQKNRSSKTFQNKKNFEDLKYISLEKLQKKQKDKKKFQNQRRQIPTEMQYIRKSKPHNKQKNYHDKFQRQNEKNHQNNYQKNRKKKTKNKGKKSRLK